MKDPVPGHGDLGDGLGRRPAVTIDLPVDGSGHGRIVIDGRVAVARDDRRPTLPHLHPDASKRVRPAQLGAGLLLLLDLGWRKIEKGNPSQVIFDRQVKCNMLASNPP